MMISATQTDPRQRQAFDQAHRMQRIKIGLIGLAAVILLIGLASAVFNSVNRERPVVAIGAAETGRVAQMANTADPADADNEPLQELGVAPPATVATTNQAAQPPR